MKKILAFSFYLLVFTCAFAQEPVWRIDTNVIALGDQTMLHMPPTAGAIGGEGIVVLGQSFDTATGLLSTVITSFEPGEHWLKVGEDSTLLTVNDVEGVDTTSVEIKDITPILRQPYTFWEIFRWVLLVLLLAALVWLGFFLWRRVKERKPLFAAPVAPPVPPAERALEALETLRQKGLWQQGMVKEYHTELTDIVRRYLEEAHGINSTDMTTGQTLEAFSASQVCTDETFRLLRQMLETADMVKFAKSEPLPHQHDGSMAAAVEFVKGLREQRLPQDETGNGKQ